MLEKHRDYLLLNRNLLTSIFSALIISSIFAQMIKGQSEYIHATSTIGVSYVVYYCIFCLLYYRDNKTKYISKTGTVNKLKLRKDIFKIITSVGIAEIIYFVSRWILHYYLLELGHEPFIASIVAHLLSAIVFVIFVNVGMSRTNLFKKQVED